MFSRDTRLRIRHRGGGGGAERRDARREAPERNAFRSRPDAPVVVARVGVSASVSALRPALAGLELAARLRRLERDAGAPRRRDARGNGVDGVHLRRRRAGGLVRDVHDEPRGVRGDQDVPVGVQHRDHLYPRARGYVGGAYGCDGARLAGTHCEARLAGRALHRRTPSARLRVPNADARASRERLRVPHHRGRAPPGLLVIVSLVHPQTVRQAEPARQSRRRDGKRRDAPSARLRLRLRHRVCVVAFVLSSLRRRPRLRRRVRRRCVFVAPPFSVHGAREQRDRELPPRGTRVRAERLRVPHVVVRQAAFRRCPVSLRGRVGLRGICGAGGRFGRVLHREQQRVRDARDEAVRGEHDARDAFGGLQSRAAALEAGQEPGALRVLGVQAPGRVPRARGCAEAQIGLLPFGGDTVIFVDAEPGDRGGEERDVRVRVAELQRGPELAREARHRELAELPQGLALGGGDRERRARGVQPEYGVVPEVHLDAPVLQEHRAEHVGHRAGVHQGGQAQRGQRRGLVGHRRRGRGQVMPRVREVHPLGRGERIVRLGARRGRRGNVPRPRVGVSRHRRRGVYLSRVPARRDRRLRRCSCAGESVLERQR